MTKYREYYQKMITENAKVFEAFKKMHEDYAKDSSLQDKYNELGKPILALVREYEDRLCGVSEASGYSAYSGNLAEKFWSEVRREFPLIDRIGVVIKNFDIKKIKLL